VKCYVIVPNGFIFLIRLIKCTEILAKARIK
jgi:hypothetical protein